MTEEFPVKCSEKYSWIELAFLGNFSGKFFRRDFICFNSISMY